MKIKKINECGDSPQVSYKDDYIGWDKTEGKKNRLATYRRFAGIDENCKITEDTLSDYALNATSCLHNCDKNRVRAEVLGEEWGD